MQWLAQVLWLQLWGWGLNSLAPLCPVAGHGDTEPGPNTPSHRGPSGQTSPEAVSSPGEGVFCHGCSGTLTSQARVVGKGSRCSCWHQNHSSLDEGPRAPHLSSLALPPLTRRRGTAQHPGTGGTGCAPQGSCVCGEHTRGSAPTHRRAGWGTPRRPDRRQRACMRPARQLGRPCLPSSLNTCPQTAASAPADIWKETILRGVASCASVGRPRPPPT